jgi:hypothetical protein
MTKKVLMRARLAGWLGLAGIAAACTSDLDRGGASSESHFLDYCTSACGSGLDCISGVCTRGCLIDKNGCGDLSERAVCTDQSIEPGEVAVCDVECRTHAECAELGDDYQCAEGYCRSGEPSTGAGGASGGAPSTGGASPTGGASDGGASPSTGGASDGGEAGAPSTGSPICLPAYESFDTTLDPDVSTCYACECGVQELRPTCSQIGCDGIPV